MGDKDSDQSEFSKLLAEECALILESDLFARAPIQSKLLSFLCAKGVEGDAIINQYVVAVDGLGRNEDYNLDSDSYPRVQMSRLRSNLASYYSSHRSASSLCVYIKPGEYALRLASRDLAYPSLFKYSDQSEASPPSTLDAGQPEAIPQGAEQKPAPTEPTANETFSAVTKMALASVALATAMLFYALIKYNSNLDDTPILSGPPTVALEVPRSGYFNLNDGNRQLAANVERMARNQIAESFVSNLAMLDTSAATIPSYTIRIDLGDGLTGPEATIFLIDKADTELFQTSINMSGDKEMSLRRVNAALANLTGPSGLLAGREVARIDGQSRSAYECQLLIEDERARGISIADRVESCLQSYPNDKQAASWLARKALGLFFSEVSQGSPVSADSEAWQFVTRALTIDEYNPYANFVAAKVRVAEGHCQAAQVFLERARDRSKSYPTMIAATYAESGGCISNSETLEASTQEQSAEILALIDTNPMPPVPLRVNLILAGLSMGRADLVTKAGELPVSYNKNGNDQALGEALAFSNDLQTANSDIAYFQANRGRIAAKLRIYIWNEAAREKVLETLDQ